MKETAENEFAEPWNTHLRLQRERDRLTAAAPGLLEALEDIARLPHLHGDALSAPIRIARAAVAKAKGKA